MATDYGIIAAGLFAIGAVVGVIIIVAIGIKSEERAFREWRRSRQEQGTWEGPEAPDHFFPAAPPGPLSHGARALTRLRARRYRLGVAPEPVPGRTRGPS
jgi:hypothetical protein